MALKLFLPLLFTCCFAFGQSNQKKCQEAILLWANNIFEYYDNPRFENYNEIPSSAYFTLSVQKEMNQEFLDEIIFNYYEGKSDRTAEKLSEDSTRLANKIAEIDKKMLAFENKVDHFEYYMWANIQTTGGITVYYQHYFKLDADYNILEYKVSGFVGKDSDDLEILYKES